MGDFDLSPDPAQPSPDAGLPDAVGNVSDYLYNRGGREAKEQFDLQNLKMNIDPIQGIANVTMPLDMMQKHMDQSAKYDQISKIYENQVNQLEQQRAQIRQHPFANTLATIAGSLAANDPNPISRGLGQAAQRLNPTDAELQAREQIPLAGMRETQTAKVGQEREDRLAKAQETRLNLAEREQNRRELADSQKSRYQEQLIDQQEQRAALTEKMVGLKEASAERRQAERDKTLLEAAMIRTRASIDAVNLKNEAALQKQAGKETEVPKNIPEKLANLSAAEKSLDNIEAKLKKFSDLQGVIAGRTKGAVAGYFNKEAAQFFTNLKLEVAQTIQSTGAGARGFGPMERGFFEKLATAKTHSPEENLGIIKGWRDYIRQKRSAYADAYKGLSDKKYKAAFGKDADVVGDSDDGKEDPLGIR